MIRNLINRFIRKSGLARPEQWLNGALGAEESSAGITVTAEGSLASSTVAACCRLLSESVASLPLHLFKREQNGKVRARDKQLYKVLHERPNPFISSYTWRVKMMLDKILHGNAYSIVERNISGEVVALWPLSPDSVQLKAEGGTLVYEVRIKGEKQTFQFGDILHFRGPSLDGITGRSIISMAREGIGLDLAIARGGAALYRNQMRPSAVLQTPHALSKEQRAQIIEAWKASNSGADNFGKIAIAENGTELKQIGLSSEDAQYVQSRQFSVFDVCRWFRVSAHMVGDPSRTSYASSEAEYNAFLTFSLAPHLREMESEMCLILLPEETDLIVEFDANGATRGSQADRYAAYEKGLGGANPWLTVADVRAAENLPFLPGTDQLPQKEVPRVTA